MIQAPGKPARGIIEEREEWDGLRLSWPHPAAGTGRFGTAAFLMFWLCGWAFGWVMVAGTIAAGKGNLFLFGWLGAWTIGGGAAIRALWLLLRRPRPESVVLGWDALAYDPGTSPAHALQRNSCWTANTRGTPEASYDRIKKRNRIPKDELGKFVVDRVGERQRLTFDWGAQRVEVGSCLGEPEREWLQAVLEAWRVG